MGLRRDFEVLLNIIEHHAGENGLSIVQFELTTQRSEPEASQNSGFGWRAEPAPSLFGQRVGYSGGGLFGGSPY